MARKNIISSRILKILGQKKIFSAQELKNKASFLIAAVSRPENKASYAITRAVKNLREAGLIEVFFSEHDEYIRLTPDGQRRLHELRIASENSLVNPSWDGLWRFVILDVPEERKSEREAVRYLLKKAGFACLKNSVWVSPHPFEHLFTSIKNDLGFTTEMMIIVTSVMDAETEQEIRNLFMVG